MARDLRLSRGGVFWNWSGTQQCRPDRFVAPRSTDEVSEIVGAAASSGGTVKAVGAGHSFTSAACTAGTLMTLREMSGVVDVDTDRRHVTLRGGTRILDASALMAERGLAFSSLGDIGEQSVAGAIATATHGTGLGYPGIPGQVEAIELVDGRGELRSLDARSGGDMFRAAQVGLGALGIVTAVTFRAEPLFNLRTKGRKVAWAEALDTLHERIAEHEHYEMFWFPHTDTALTLAHDRTDKVPRAPKRVRTWFEDVVVGNWFWDFQLRIARRFPSRTPALNQRVVSMVPDGTSVKRGDLAFTNERRVRFAEMEYCVPLDALDGVLREVRRSIESSGMQISFPIEVRVSAADTTLLGPSSGRRSGWVAVHMYRGIPYEAYFGMIEGIMLAAGGRPHWGKLHTRRAADLAPAYEGWDAFHEARRELDPGGVFANAYTDQVLGAPGGDRSG